MFTLRPLSLWLLVVCVSIPLSTFARDSKLIGKLGGGKPAAVADPQDEADSDDSGDKDDRAKRFETKIDTPLIGDYTNFAGLEPVVLEGVGLVVGLNGTGGDPAPSAFRTKLMEDLKKNGVPNPNSLLQRPDTALVLVRAYLPPLLKKGEKIDVEVRVPDSADASSLAGGWLMEMYLTEQAFIPGRGMLQGHAYAKAEGAILTKGIGSDAANAPALLKQGRVLGGATVVKERDLSLFLRSEYRSIRTSTRIAEVIGRRFHHFDKQGIKKPMAEAKTDQKIVLSVHPEVQGQLSRATCRSSATCRSRRTAWRCVSECSVCNRSCSSPRSRTKRPCNWRRSVARRCRFSSRADLAADRMPVSFGNRPGRTWVAPTACPHWWRRRAPNGPSASSPLPPSPHWKKPKRTSRCGN